MSLEAFHVRPLGELKLLVILFILLFLLQFHFLLVKLADMGGRHQTFLLLFVLKLVDQLLFAQFLLLLLTDVLLDV